MRPWPLALCVLSLTAAAQTAVLSWQELEARHGPPQQVLPQPDGATRLRWVVTGQRFQALGPMPTQPVMTLDSTGRPVISHPNPMLLRRELETWACTLDYLLDAQGLVRELRLAGTGCDIATRR
jgi:hypothetical protein